jgi:hypothetical protein
MKKLPCLLVLGMVGVTVAVSAELYRRAPDVLPGTLPEMRTTEYWIQKMAKPDEVILTPDAIERMNQAYEKFIRTPDPFQGQPKERVPSLSYWWPGHVNYVPDLKAVTPQALADTVRAKIKIEIDFMRSKPFGNILAVEYRKEDLNRFEREMAFDTVSNSVKPRAGISVRCTRLRNVPSFYPMEQGVTENGKTRWDQWNIAIVKIAMPLTVLHASRSGEYQFVLCDEGWGWVRSEDIAFGSEKAIQNFSKASDFVVCTGDRVQFYGDESCTLASGFFRMGDCLPLASKSNPRLVKIPMRKANGDFYTENAWLAKDSATHVGWLPYTRRNVVLTAFNLLDNHYDWSGAWFGRQHENTYRDIFAVFGFRLPWHGGLFTFFGKNTEVMRSNIGKENQYKEILRHEPFITLQSCGGHAQLLLGEYNGMPIVFDQHGYGYKDENGQELEIRRCCIGDMRQPAYFLTRNVTFLELK